MNIFTLEEVRSFPPVPISRREGGLWNPVCPKLQGRRGARACRAAGGVPDQKMTWVLLTEGDF